MKIRKGFDIRLTGEAQKTLVGITSRYYASKPVDFTGVVPKLLVKEGDPVKAGSPLYFDKYNEKVFFTSPVSGKVSEIRRGEKRLLLEVVVEADGLGEHIDFGKEDPGSLTREQVTQKMLGSGVWPVLRQRPFGTIPKPGSAPRGIFISAFDTAPLAPDSIFLITGHEKAFQTGIDALKKLTDGIVHLSISADNASLEFFSRFSGAELHRFSGPHPAGNTGTQIHCIEPVNKGETVWTLRPQEVLTIGRLFLSGFYDATRVYALTGSMALRPAYYKTLAGASVEEMIHENISEGNLRIISGNVLTGRKIERDGFTGFYDAQVTVIPEGNYHEFFGWALPGMNKFSFYGQFLSKLLPGRKYRLDTNMHGGERAFVITGKYERVFPFDIYPMQLLKAILAEDIDLMENLGIYEVLEEDFALIEFIDTSKTDIQSIIRKGLDLVRKETT